MALLRLAFATASDLKSLTLQFRITRWPILQKVRHQAVALCLLVGARFQVLFHSPFGVLFTFPSRYLFAIGHMLVFSLRGWAPCLHSKLLVFTATCSLVYNSFYLQDFHFLWFIFPDDLINYYILLVGWAVFCSLAATWKIEFSFFSSCYLDVSVRRVLLH